MSNYHSNDVQSFFGILNKLRSKSIEVFLISVNYCSKSILNTRFTSTPEHQVSGHVFANSTGNTLDNVMIVLARYILRCSCRKGVKCQVKLVATTGCRFERTSNGGEICYENVTREILSQPDSFDKDSCATE
uniref:Uncharacterized protein n=1 Tax=Romanomermis culicivorax TaxID=13658 RepID=A0A915L436_ROMCU